MAWKMWAFTLPTEVPISRAISSYFQSFCELQQEGLLLALGQVGQGLPQQAPGLLVQDMVHLVVLHPQGGVLLAVLAGFQGLVPRAGAVQEVQGLAGGDGDEPGAEAGLEAEAGQGPVDPQEGLLDHVVGVQVVLDDGEGLAVDVPLEHAPPAGRRRPGPPPGPPPPRPGSPGRGRGIRSRSMACRSHSRRWLSWMLLHARASRLQPRNLLQKVDPGAEAGVEWNPDRETR